MRQLSLSYLTLALIVGMLASCARMPRQPAPAPASVTPSVPAAPTPSGAARQVQPRSHWVAVDWSELPGWPDDALHQAWHAWLRSCERSGTALVMLCQQVRLLSIASPQEQRDWMEKNLQPHRVEDPQGETRGLLTGYYEPVLRAARQANAEFAVPLYQPPADLAQRKPWYSRQEIDTLPQAQAALRGREIVYLADPVDALVLQIQGSGRVLVSEPDGSQRLLRMAYAGTNEQPYRSVGRWLLDRGEVRDASWPGIKAWLAANPGRVQELLWSNPRVVFFREEVLSPQDAQTGPRGAEGVALTPGRSIAVDPGSIPYGTPVWLATEGPTLRLQRLVLAQDTGSAITGAVRADYFVGWAEGSAELAGRLKQPLRLWALWPR